MGHPVPSANPRLLDGRYALRHVLAYGGMGTVWVASDERLGRRVAVKMLARHLGGDRTNRRRFAREAAAVAQVRSLHVVQIYDFGIAGGTPYIVMELLDGESLDARLRRRGRLGLHETAGIVRQLCKGLAAAHDVGLVHRDIKPSNVLLARTAEDAEIVKLLDFGLAKGALGLAEVTTQQRGLLGTPQYMSPEQVLGRQLDARSDVWSVGVLAFRMLVGRPPFDGSIHAVIMKVCRSDVVPSPSAFVDDLPRELDLFFEGAFARDPDRRWASADALARTLDAIAAGEEPAPAPLRSGICPRGSCPSDEAISLIDVSVSFEDAPPPPPPAEPSTGGPSLPIPLRRRRSRALAASMRLLFALVIAALSALGVMWLARRAHEVGSPTPTHTLRRASRPQTWPLILDMS